MSEVTDYKIKMVGALVIPTIILSTDWTGTAVTSLCLRLGRAMTVNRHAVYNK